MRNRLKQITASLSAISLLTSLALVGVPGAPLGVAPAAAEGSASIIKIKRGGPGVSKRVKLGLNKAVVVDLPSDAHDILVADPSLADAVTRTSRRIYLFGKTVGQTNIFVFGSQGEEIVSIELEIERDVAGLEGYLARFIPDSDITVEIISDNIVLTGSVRTPQDAAQAARLADIFLTGGEATTRNLTAVGDGGDAAIFAEERQRSQIVNMLKIDGEDQVTLKVTVAEVSRQVLKQLGFNSSISGSAGRFVNANPQNLGALNTGVNFAQLTGNVSGYSIASYINAMEQAGVMRTLAEPSLTAISGEPANFYVGGEFQVRDSVDYEEQDDGSRRAIYTDREVEYGIRLNFLPVVLSPGRISLRIQTEVSEPTFEGSTSLQGGGSAPGLTRLAIKRREAETSVELPSGGSIVLAGLVQDNVRQAMSGYPGISKIPVLGTLFRSKDFVRNETELVIIATPYLVKPVARNQLSRPDDNFNPPNDGAGFFLGKVNRVYGRMETDLPPGRYHGAIGFIYK